MAISLAEVYKYVKLSTAGYVDLAGVSSVTAAARRAGAAKRIPSLASFPIKIPHIVPA